ncbi:hypothetical protein OSB04_022530 [Centaurea solstitialis]|uniref:Protein RER1 n=1 Tax=Centaurea solstitialis TaxID=347529 RepID=A0AA38TEP9_9ASTR|nr:hypothetical protein OSB04_022530 [Centaurea solstitialis]
MGTTTTTAAAAAAALPPSGSPVSMTLEGETTDALPPAPAALQRWGFVVSQRYQHLLDKSTPFLVCRWIVFCAIAIPYAVVFFYLEKGSCVVSFALGIYILRLLLGFLTPQVDDDQPTPLPSSSNDDEFRPFLRLRTEFKFWYSMTKAFSIAFVFTFFPLFTMLDVHIVCTPLLFYWILAVAIVTKLHIQDMLKYKYFPFSFSSRKKQLILHTEVRRREAGTINREYKSSSQRLKDPTNYFIGLLLRRRLIEGMPSACTVGDLPPELHCPLCIEVMKDAVLTSKCCFTSFCDKCYLKKGFTTHAYDGFNDIDDGHHHHHHHHRIRRRSSICPATVSMTSTASMSVSPVLQEEVETPALQRWGFVVSQRYQHLLDKSTPFRLYRWMVFCAIAIAFVVRFFYFEQGSCFVSFALGIYIIRLLVGFLSPQGNKPTPLPTRSSDEFRPFLRLRTEFKFWYSMTKAFSIAFVFTFFTMLDLHIVCTPLLFYWICAFAIVTKLHIQHMLKYKYNPFSFSFSSRKKKKVLFSLILFQL